MSLDDGGDGLSILWPGSHHGGPLVGAPGPPLSEEGCLRPTVAERAPTHTIYFGRSPSS